MLFLCPAPGQRPQVCPVRRCRFLREVPSRLPRCLTGSFAARYTREVACDRQTVFGHRALRSAMRGAETMTCCSVIIGTRGLLVPAATRRRVATFAYRGGGFGGRSVPMSGKPASWEDTY